MNIALLLLEIQNDYFPKGKKELDKSLSASEKAKAALTACRAKKQHIIHALHISTQPNASYLLPCTKGAEFFPSLQPLKEEFIIKKHYPNSFKDTGLLDYLIKNQINHLVICGMMTHLTVDATTRAACDLGFSCTILEDACAAKQLEFNGITIPEQQVHSAFLATLKDNYAAVLNTNEFLQQLGSSTTTTSASIETA
jgi:nicotinamidase-related amidase